MSCFGDMNGIGASSLRSNTSATSHSTYRQSQDLSLQLFGSETTGHPLITSQSDPFVEMAKHNKTYGFTIAVKELRETIPNLFRYASAYRRKHNLTSKGMWEMFTVRPIEDENFYPENDARWKKTLPQTEPDAPGSLPEIDDESMEGEVYNRCHFWSNFEIARLDWFRSKEYEDFFENMDRSGGFWMERVCCACTSSPTLVSRQYLLRSNYNSINHIY